MTATVAKASDSTLRRSKAEVISLLTYAKARIVDTGKNLKAWCRERCLDYSRISKLINRTRGYVATPEESQELARWLDLPEHLLFEDAWEALKKIVDRHPTRKKRSG